jgi:hypothetical protein
LPARANVPARGVDIIQFIPRPGKDHEQTDFPTSEGSIGRADRSACTKYPENINVS